MSRLILNYEGKRIGERELDQERVTIGRRPDNDVVLPHPAVSGEHAVVITIRNDSFLEDLHSTNGTRVNGKLVEKCLLQDGDEVRIAGYAVKFVFEPAPARPLEAEVDELSRQIRLAQQRMAKTAGGAEQAKPSSTLIMAAHDWREGGGGAVPAAGLRILNGPSAGKTVDLVRTTTSLGKPGIQVAVITRGPTGYELVHQQGDVRPLLNGVPLGEEHEVLKDHDIIEVVGTRLEFFLKQA